MPFPFTLPTTSYADLSKFYSSSTHPSLPFTTTEKRAALREALKAHKRLPASSQAANLPTVISALNAYIPYLLALDSGLSGRAIAGEEVDIVLLRDAKFSWRCTLTATNLPRDSPRTKLRSLDADIFFVIHTLALALALTARESLRPLYRTDAPPLATPERTQLVSAAMRALYRARNVHAWLVGRMGESGDGSGGSGGSGGGVAATVVADLERGTAAALAQLALAEFTLVAVLKDDPYAIAVGEARNAHGTDWMWKATDLSLARTNLMSRFCLKAAEYAGGAWSTLRNVPGGLDPRLVAYAQDLKATAKAKGCRLQGIGVEGQGRAGEAVAWIHGAQHELGTLKVGSGKVGGMLSGLKKDWKEKKEDKRIVKGDADWGVDAGKFEEGRVLDMLDKKWVKLNDTMTMQIIPDFKPLLSQLPEGRDYPWDAEKVYVPPSLEADILAKMRAPPDYSVDKAYQYDEDSQSDIEPEDPVGAFPGTGKEYNHQESHY